MISLTLIVGARSRLVSAHTKDLLPNWTPLTHPRSEIRIIELGADCLIIAREKALLYILLKHRRQKLALILYNKIYGRASVKCCDILASPRFSSSFESVPSVKSNSARPHGFCLCPLPPIVSPLHFLH